jgi:hypothetical protein
MSSPPLSRSAGPHPKENPREAPQPPHDRTPPRSRRSRDVVGGQARPGPHQRHRRRHVRCPPNHTRNRVRPLPTGDEATKFVEVLAAAIEANLASLADVELPMVTLGVDYGPDAILGDAARAGGCPGWVPDEDVHVGHVRGRDGEPSGTGRRSVSCGRPRGGCRRAPRVVLRSGGQSDQLVEDYHGEPFVCSLPRYHEERSHRYDQPIALCAASGRREGGATHDPEGWLGARAHAFTPKPA